MKNQVKYSAVYIAIALLLISTNAWAFAGKGTISKLTPEKQIQYDQCLSKIVATCSGEAGFDWTTKPLTLMTAEQKTVYDACNRAESLKCTTLVGLTK